MGKRTRENNLAHDFFRWTRDAPDREALWVDERAWSYAELRRPVSALAGWFKSRHPEGGARIGILANRTVEAYVGVLAALWSGNVYVPLNNKLPTSYLAKIIARAELSAVVIDRNAYTTASKLCPHAVDVVEWITPCDTIDDCNELDAVSPNDISETLPLTEPVAVAPDHTAYIVFTSGSTGIPKGIAPTVTNVAHFLDATQERYRLSSDDRFSQFNDLPWDPSVFDLFSAWKVGAATYVVPDRQLFAPAHFIRRHQLTIWYSGPVQINLLNRMKQLKEGSLPSLRLSLFVGEPLLAEAAAAWQNAAPNSLVENVYGPTETTVVCLGQPYSESPECLTPERDFVAIGKTYSCAKVAIIDEDRNFAEDNQQGEIVISGPVVAPGYWKDPQLTAEKFVKLPESTALWYLTGDLGYKTENDIFHFLGRKDNQVQIRGLRVELDEVEHYLRQLIATDEVAVIPWPVSHDLVEGLVAFIGHTSVEISTIRTLLHDRLPSFMIPKTLHSLPSLPRNINHKIDRKALNQWLQDQEQ